MRISNGVCTHPKSVIIDAGSGAWVYDRADNMRTDGLCGKKGKLFEQETHVFRKVLREASVFDVIDKLYTITAHVVAFLLALHTITQ